MILAKRASSRKVIGENWKLKNESFNDQYT